ncbi:DUF4142 domain-containing protein [Actinoplanes siamensis]|nr:DUF4142 domain-containing protein [Actinoplanes siamensis]
MRRLVTVLGVVAALVAPASVAQATDPTTPAARRLDPDAAFLRTVHQGNLAQIALGRIAARKGGTPEIRRLGARFAADSARLDAAVRNAAGSMRVTLATEPNTTVQQSVRTYRAAGQADFDQLFLSSQATLHAKAVRLIRAELADGDEPTVRRIAQGALPMVKRHRAALAVAARR